MYVSVFLGPFARGSRDDRATIEYCLKQAEEAANAGFSMVTFGEQHFNNYEPYCNPFLMGARLSDKLGRTYFATTICPLVFHNPIRLAEDINVLDQLLSGRLIVGMSAGRVGFSPDFENFGLDPKDQRAIYAEKYAALQKLWTHKLDDGPIRFDGQWVKGGLHGRLMPVSYRAPGPAVAIGTNTDATIRSAGLEGNYVFLGPCARTEAIAKFALYSEALEEAGLSAAAKADRLAKSMVHHQTIVGESDDDAWKQAETMAGRNPLLNRSNDGRTMRQMWDDAESDKQGLSEQEAKNSRFVHGWYIVGGPETVTAELKAHADGGVQQVHTRFTVGAYNPEGWDRSFKLFVDEVMPRIDAQTFDGLPEDEIQQPVKLGPLPTGTSPPAGYGSQIPAQFRAQTEAAN